MIKLKGIFKHPGCSDEVAFRDWVSRTNPEITVERNEVYRVSVSEKVGKKRRLKKYYAYWSREFPACTCCDPYWDFRLELVADVRYRLGRYAP